MRTEYRGLRLACHFLSEVDPEKEPIRYQRRREALQALNFVLGVRTVLEGCQMGHEKVYIDKLDAWTD